MPWGDGIRRRSSFAARLLIQLGRHTGPTLRRLLGVRPHAEAKAVADFLLAAMLLADSQDSNWVASYSEPLIARLERLAVQTPNGLGWGLSFPYATRFISVPAQTPNSYTTISCVGALTVAARQSRDARALELAIRGARTITEDLGVAIAGERRWFRYWPGVDTCIVNLQALIAAALQELSEFAGDRDLTGHARSAASVVIDAQRPDGSFPYALDGRGQFIDAFHTGFVLEGLTRFRARGGDLAGIDSAVAHGYEYMRLRLVGESGWPLARPGGNAVRDGQNVGQLVQTLVICGAGEDRAPALDLWHRCAAELTHGGASRSLRWDVGPMVVAGAHLGSSCGGPE
jgi:hypothetical protein